MVDPEGVVELLDDLVAEATAEAEHRDVDRELEAGAQAAADREAGAVELAVDEELAFALQVHRSELLDGDGGPVRPAFRLQEALDLLRLAPLLVTLCTRSICQRPGSSTAAASGARWRKPALRMSCSSILKGSVSRKTTPSRGVAWAGSARGNRSAIRAAAAAIRRRPPDPQPSALRAGISWSSMTKRAVSTGPSGGAKWSRTPDWTRTKSSVGEMAKSSASPLPGKVPKRRPSCS